MFSLAYVLLPFADAPPGEAIAASLARFRRGRRGDVPDDWLAFHDETAEVKEAHRTRFTFTRSTGLRTEGGDGWILDIGSIMEEITARGSDRWTVRFADVEPDLTRFAGRFLRSYERHPSPLGSDIGSTRSVAGITGSSAAGSTGRSRGSRSGPSGRKATSRPDRAGFATPSGRSRRRSPTRCVIRFRTSSMSRTTRMSNF